MKKQDSKPAATDDVPSPLSIIRDLQNGTLLPASISSEVRRGCVEHLVGEGYSVAEVAQVFSVSPRTVHRDISAIRESNALQPDPQLVAVMAGRLWGAADQAVQRLRRIAREKETDAAVRVDAERTAWTVQRELVEILQRLGHLPGLARQGRDRSRGARCATTAARAPAQRARESCHGPRPERPCPATASAECTP